ncbi:hypothetical protein P7K49_028475 [Saguinus oedipus]|uniref:Taste receptor cell protein 1 n=1 Tax=Saguinus oedipus TaxID=9490 RepID=A0ABQ9UCE7_SAGOE|nr:hypothetical protein P7K49_028475 [Saguinus oedipus]
MNASLVFGGHAPGPSPCEVLWALYHKVKSSGQMLGKLSLAENSLTSDGESRSQPLLQCLFTCPVRGGGSPGTLEGFSFCPDPEAAGGAGGEEGPGASRTPTHGSTGADLITLARETISIHFTAMKPFLLQLLVHDSVPFVLLEGQILQQVTPVVSGFYKASPQERTLLLFSNADQWVGVYIEYKFQTPVPTHLQGLANHLARNIRDPILQKSSIVANGEKAELVLSEVWLWILGQPHTKALEHRASPEFWALQGQLSRWAAQDPEVCNDRPTRLDPLTARMGATFFREAPAQALVWDHMRQGLHTLWEAEGLLEEMVIPDFGTPSPTASRLLDAFFPGYAMALLILGLLLLTLALVLVSVAGPGLLPEGQAEPLTP